MARRCFTDSSVQEVVARESVRGGAFSVLARAVTGVVQIGSVLFLARLLSPEDYGLVAMVTAFTGFPQIFVDLGTRDAVVQRATLTEGEASALFWITLSVGCSFSLIVAGIGPFLAAFYGEPRLAAIAAVSSLSFLGVAFTSQHQALLRRALMFQQLSIIEVSANVLSVITAVTMAYFGVGYWALVTRPVTAYFFTAVGVWSYCRWLPGRPAFTEGVKQMVKFGLNLTGFCVFDFAGRNMDRVAVGRSLGAKVLGYYQNALFIYDNLIDILVLPLHQVAVSSLSKLRDRPDELRRSWAKALSTVSFFVMPVFGVLAVTGQDAVVLLLGPKWAMAGVIVSVFALRGIPHSVERTLGWLHVTAGRTDRWMRWGAFAMSGQIVALVCGLPFGPTGVAAAYVVWMYLVFVPALAYAGKPLGIGATDVVRVVGRQFSGALAAVGVGFGVRSMAILNDGPAVRVGSLGLIYVVTYLLIVAGLMKVREPVRILGSFLSGGLSRGALGCDSQNSEVSRPACS